MGSSSDKLTYLNKTKSLINKAIKSTGVNIPAGTAFRDYAKLVADNNIIDRGLLVHYPLNTQSDELKSGATSTDTAVIYSGSSANFDGSTSQIVCTNPLNSATDTNFTISIWVKGASVSASNDNDFAISLGGSFGEIQTGGGSSNKLRIMGNGYYREVSQTTAGLTDVNKYYHLVMVVRDSVPELYVDGKLIATTAVSSGAPTITPMTIGGRNGSLFWYGSISNVKIFNVVIPDDQIRALYNEGYHPRSFEDVTEGLIHHFPLTGTSEDIVGGVISSEEGGLTYYNATGAGSSALFNGSDTRVKVTTMSVTGDMTLVFNLKALNATNWAYLLDTDGVTRFSLATNDPSGNGYNIYEPGNTYNFGYVPSQTDFEVAIFTVSNKVMKLYIDGVFKGQVTLTYDYVISAGTDLTHGTTIGAVRGGGNYSAMCKMNNFQIFDRVLSESEIKIKSKYIRNLRQVAIDDGLIAYIPNKRDSQDNTYNQNNPSEVGTITRDNNSALLTDDDRFDFSTALLPADIFSFCSWIKPSAFSWPDAILSQYTAGTSGRMIVAAEADGNVMLTAGNVNSAHSSSLIFPNMLEVDKWRHLAVVKNGSSGWFVYIDGVLIYNWLDTQNIQTSTPTQMFGDQQWGANYGLAGRVGRQRIYNRAITEDEIRVIVESEGVDFKQEVNLTDTLAGYWPLATSANSGMITGGTNGTDVLTPTYDGQSVLLDQDDEYIRTNVILSSQTFSYSIWSKRTGTALSKSMIGNYGTYSGGMQGGHLYHQSDTHASQPQYVAFGIDDVYINSGVAVDMSRFRHIVITFQQSPSEMKLYVDGELLSTLTSFSAQNYAKEILIGKAGDAASSTNTWDGNLARARAYNKVLTQAEVTKIYNDEKGKF